MQMTGVIANRTCAWEILCHHVHVLIVKVIQYTVLPLYVILSGIRHAWKMGRGSWSWYVAAAPPSRRPPRACAWRRRSPWPGRHERHMRRLIGAATSGKNSCPQRASWPDVAEADAARWWAGWIGGPLHVLCPVDYVFGLAPSVLKKKNLT